MSSIFGMEMAAPYSATKGGVVQLTRSLASAWARDNIQVNCILPGWIDTGLTQGKRELAAANATVLRLQFPQPTPDVFGLEFHQFCSAEERFDVTADADFVSLVRRRLALRLQDLLAAGRPPRDAPPLEPSERSVTWRNTAIARVAWRRQVAPCWSHITLLQPRALQ